MKSHIAKSVLTATLALAAYYPAQAGSLQVEPVLVDVTAPGAASTVSLRNEGTTPISARHARTADGDRDIPVSAVAALHSSRLPTTSDRFDIRSPI